MFERFTDDARATVAEAHAHATRLHHGWIGCEHLLMALASRDNPVGEAFRESGVTAQSVESTILHKTGMDNALFEQLDRAALASVGIDVDEVRSALERSFGRDALNLVRHYRQPRTRRFPPWRRHRMTTPLTGRAKDCLSGALKVAMKDHVGYIGTEHLARSALSMKHSTVPNILAALGVSPDTLRTTIADKYRKAG